ncbi:MAG TPA: aldose 1-epimerase family protein [Puia sp.]|nr:aldose 1-epimerase family protein [Puia sp.]
MFTIENQEIRATIHPKGAELQSLFHKYHDLEYMWGGDPAFWGKHSPLLFPIVGTLKGNTYYYGGKAYSLPRHGFARDREFAVESQRADTITFQLESDEKTLSVFPFPFELRVGYRLVSNKLSVTYQVRNPAETPLYFSVGGHPAFRVPLIPGTDYSDYYLEFDGIEDTPRWPISKDGLIEKKPQPLLEDTAVLPLRKELFAKDALVLKNPISNGATLRSSHTDRSLRMDFPYFPFLGLWAAPNADFICIEPWCGIADPVDSDQQLENKEGINELAGGGIFHRNWTVSLY